MFHGWTSSLVFWEHYSMCNIFSSTHCIVSFLLDFLLFSLFLVSAPCCCNSKMWGSVARAYFPNPVVKPKFTCLMHREARQTATLEFVTEFYLGHQRRIDSSCSKDQHCLIVFEKHFLKTNLGGRTARFMTFVWLVDGEVTGWCFKNNNQPSGI